MFGDWFVSFCTSVREWSRNTLFLLDVTIQPWIIELAAELLSKFCGVLEQDAELQIKCQCCFGLIKTQSFNHYGDQQTDHLQLFCWLTKYFAMKWKHQRSEFLPSDRVTVFTYCLRSLVSSIFLPWKLCEVILSIIRHMYCYLRLCHTWYKCV